MGIITKSATIKDMRKRGFFSVAAFFNPLITIFKNQLNPIVYPTLNKST